MADSHSGSTVAVISTVHDTFDTRIYYKQIESLRRHYRVLYFTPLADTPPEDWIIPLRASASKLGRIRTHLSLLARLPRHRADLYLLHDPELLPIGLLLRCLGRKVVWDMHEDTYHDIHTKTYLPRGAVTLIAAVYRAVQALAHRMLNGFVLAEDKYAEYFPGSRKTCIVHNYPLLERLDEHATAEKLPNSIVYIGSISANRGIYQMLDAVEILRQRIPDVLLTLIGPFADGALESRVRQHIHARGLEGNVELLGRIRNADAYPLVARRMVGIALLLPEPNFTDSLPTKMFEYMALGLPVVVSNFPLWSDIVREHDAGVAVDPNDAGAAAESISGLLTDRVRYMSSSGNARRAASLYSWDTEGGRLVDFIARILRA